MGYENMLIAIVLISIGYFMSNAENRNEEYRNHK